MADNIKQLVTSYSFKKQTAIGSPRTLATDFRTFTQRNRIIPNIKRETATNENEIGAGLHATTSYKGAARFSYSPEFLLSAEIASQLFPFIIGTTTKTAAGTGFQYVSTSNQSDPIELPMFTMYANLGTTVDRERHSGVAVTQVSLKWQSGPNYDNATISATLTGSGKREKGVTFTAPAAVAINQLDAGGITVHTFTPTAGSPINFNSNCQCLDGEFTIERGAKDSNYRACDSKQDGFTTMGVMRVNALKFGLTTTVEVQTGSTEEDLFIAGTVGALDLKFEGAAIGAGPELNTLRVQFPRCTLVIEDKAEADDVTVFKIQYIPLYDSVTSAICKVTVITVTDLILT